MTKAANIANIVPTVEYRYAKPPKSETSALTSYPTYEPYALSPKKNTEKKSDNGNKFQK